MKTLFAKFLIPAALALLPCAFCHAKDGGAAAPEDLPRRMILECGVFSAYGVGPMGGTTKGMSAVAHLAETLDKKKASAVFEGIFLETKRAEAKLYALYGLYIIGDNEKYSELSKKLSGRVEAQSGCMGYYTDASGCLPSKKFKNDYERHLKKRALEHYKSHANR